MALERTSGAVVYRHHQGQLEYLLLQSTNQGNFWGFPKGHVEGDETLLATAKREIKEETGLALTINTQFAVYTQYDLPNGNHKEMTLFTAELADQAALTLQAAEIKNAAWLPYQAARERLTYDNLKQLLDEANAYLTAK
ncbi:NUDIX domain-containing protein [Lactobacillus alvi]|uniref:Bis(5'-nucleosyl)-tetraphosphatase [asymmetrical] n=1 Tax=Limosilactobacillus alvi TaxID=990412 RepID=A0ABS2EQE3_9LACO|nr:NUDIX domain-containing protein [Limosilactobacillus alvi]MBM6754610.1 NUDIX domain-containing protein [Limosilactobacillus alvi]